MKISELKGKKITVMGLGLHGGGVGTVRFLSNAGATVTVTDIKSKEELAPSLEKLKGLKNIAFVFNQHRPENFTNSDMIVKNPAAPWSNKYIQMALEKKIPVETDSSLFFKLCHNKIIGITGTKGKTITASLLYEILKNAGKNPIKVGIGQSSVLDKFNDLKKDTIVVFELSSYRLSALGRFNLSPQIAVITNIYQDHLNYYKSMVEYLADKKKIFKSQSADDFCIINADNKMLLEIEPEIKSQVIKFSAKKVLPGRSFYVNEGAIYLNDGIDEKKIIDLSNIKLRGEHNIENVLAAVAGATISGASIEAIKKTIPKFEKISHRLEFVKEIDGIKYYNDTAATTPESAIFGINSFSEPVVLISGGSDIKLDLESLGKVISEKVKGIIFLKGSATEKIISIVKKNLPPMDKDREFKIADTMEKAVELARAEAEKGDIVLLSPGVPSFGIFANEFIRGDKFKEAVGKLK